MNRLTDFIMDNKRFCLLIGGGLVACAVVTAVILLVFARKPAVQTQAESSKQSSASVESVSSQESSDIPSSEPVDNDIRLVVTSPAKTSVSTTNSTMIISGTSDPLEPVLMNGAEIQRNDQGIFSFDTSLNVGKNTFTFEHKGEKVTYTVSYRFVIIESYYPVKSQNFNGGDTIVASVSARSGSHVNAVLNGQTIVLEEKQLGDTPVEFNSFTGSFTLPLNSTAEIVSIGKVKFTATYDGKSESFSSGNISLNAVELYKTSDPSVTPQGGSYIDVGSGLVAEIVKYNAETLYGNTLDDMSRPTLNYLPEGTLDYRSASEIHANGRDYITLRCGRRVYLTDADKNAIVKTHEPGEMLPDHNEITVSQVGQSDRYTTLTFDTMWKAPFYFDILPQNYTNPSIQDYTMSSVTFSYIDITFCYASMFTGEVSFLGDNPLFSSAEVFNNTITGDHTLRLHLKHTGGFYGWDCSYNSAGQLVFEFLHPAKIASAENEYGVDLTGITVFVDAGHGGSSVGATSGSVYESHLNLDLAKRLQAILESLHATVKMSRTDDVLTSNDTRILALKAARADFAVSIHQNSAKTSDPNGYNSYHFTPFSKTAADYFMTETQNTGIYNNASQWSGVKFHYFFLARTTNCPVVLTENGFMSNADDFTKMQNDSICQEKARAMAMAIVDYFKSLPGNH